MKNRIKDLVDSRGITVYQFWQDTGISRTTAYALYNKPEQYPGRDVMDAICRVYGVQPGEVLEWIPDSPVPSPAKSKRRRGGEAIATEKDIQGIPNGTKVKVPRGWEAVVTGYLGENRYAIRYSTGLPGDEDEYPIHLLTVE